MSSLPGYAPSSPLGSVPTAPVIAEVIASRHAGFEVGQMVVAADGGWQTCSISDGTGVEILDERTRPETYALGCLGSSGMTGYVGILDIARAKAGETVVVSAASGAVGSVAGQVAKLQGCRVIGIAGGSEKCGYVVDQLGFDACIDHRAKDFREALAAACPDGIDVDFENVGGAVRDAVWSLMNTHSRVALCGVVGEYGASAPQPGPSWYEALVRRITIQGFLMRDHLHRRSDFLDQASRWVAEGKLRYREHMTNGLENTPRAFIDMLSGRNFGKAIVSLR
jgi:NADPH-dependent curcumin reductase CurA